jgi:hypothetical protein
MRLPTTSRFCRRVPALEPAFRLSQKPCLAQTHPFVLGIHERLPQSAGSVAAEATDDGCRPAQ